MLRSLSLVLLLLAVPCAAAAQDADPDSVVIPPPPGQPPPGQPPSPVAPPDVPAPAIVAPPPATGQAAALAAPAATPASPLEAAIEPLLAAASADLSAQRPGLAYSRVTFVIEVLPENAPLRVRAEGLRVLATQRMQPGEPGPSPDEVLAPLVAQADFDLRAGQPLAALPRLDLALARLPIGSPLRARAEQMRAFALSVVGPAAQQGPAPIAPPPGMYAPAPVPPEEPVDPTRRGTAEMVELYITAGMFGLLTGAYIPFVATDGDASTTAYALTMVGGAAVMAVSVLLLDLTSTLRTGVAPTISSSIRFGFANGMLAWGLAEALDPLGVDGGSAFTLIWGGAAIGAVVGVGVGLGLEPSVRATRFVESVGIWGGVLGTSIALITDYQDPVVGLALSLIGLDAGILTGIALAASGNAPSLERTLFIDLGFLAGAGVGALAPLVYYAYSGDPWEAEAFGVGMLIGSLGGFALMVGLTHGMEAEPEPDPAAPRVHVGLTPLEGGGALSLSGSF